jgi:hypothetical protein
MKVLAIDIGGNRVKVLVSGHTEVRKFPSGPTDPWADGWRSARRLNVVTAARYLLAATFGNVHGVHKPGHVKLVVNELRATGTTMMT